MADFDLINKAFTNPCSYWGILLGFTDMTFQMVDGPGDDDNEQFEIVGNNVYNKLQFKRDNTKETFKIRIRAVQWIEVWNKTRDVEGMGFLEKTFEIAAFRFTSFTRSNIFSCYSGQSLRFVWRQIGIDAASEPILLNKPVGKIQFDAAGLFYAAPLSPTDDVVVLQSNTQAPIALMVEVFDEDRIANLPKKTGTYTFENIRFDLLSSIWHFGNYRTDTFYLHHDSFIIGTAGIAGLTILNGIRLEYNRIIGQPVNNVMVYLQKQSLWFTVVSEPDPNLIVLHPNLIFYDLILIINNNNIVVNVILNSQISIILV
jgi:hypothetical protein